MARPGYLTCYTQLEQHMPELLPVYEQLCTLAGGSDLASRYLSLYNPPAYMSGCTQVAWSEGTPALVRNYDYKPSWFEGVMLHTNWLQPIIGISDCNWGLLDGMNASGLAVSLTFGGRKVTGEGFGIPLVIRYVLETCANVEQGVQALLRIPVHMAYNVTLLDRYGNHKTLMLAPDRLPAVSDSRVCTNHQGAIDWPEYALATATLERESTLTEFLKEPDITPVRLLNKFLLPPIYSQRFDQSYGTLYTAVYYPEAGSMALVWPGKHIEQSFLHFIEKRMMVNIRGIQSSLIK